MSTTHVAELLNYDRNFFELDRDYEILVIEASCSSTWVSYTPHEPIPVRAVLFGKDNDDRNYYVVSRVNVYLRIGFYIEGTDAAYNSMAGGSRSFTNILMMVLQGWKWLFLKLEHP